MSNKHHQALPKRITIGGVEFKVKEVKNLQDEDGKWLNGIVYPASCEIHIAKDMDPQIKRISLWHEVLHEMLLQSGIPHAEDVPVALSYGICELLDNNEYFLL